MANPIKSLRESLGKIPTKYRFWTSLAILAALLIALPVTLIGLMTGTFELRKRAASGEPTPIPSFCEAVNGVIDVTPGGGSGSCHDIQTAINAAKENEEVHVHAGDYAIPIHEEPNYGRRVGLFINKKIFFESDYPNTNLSIKNAEIGILVDEGVGVSISGWRIAFSGISDSGVLIQGNSDEERYFYLGVLDLSSDGTVPRLISVRGMNGATNEGGECSGIYESKLTGAELSAIELSHVNNLDVRGNEISNSPVGVEAYSNLSDMTGLNVEGNSINHVRAGIIVRTDLNHKVRNSYLSNNLLYDFGYEEYYQEEANRHGGTSISGIQLTYGEGVNISSNTLRDSGGVGIFFEGGENNLVEKNLLINNRSSFNMSGGNASFIHNTIYGNESRNGGGVSITKGSSFMNNIVANVGNYHKPGSVSDLCGLRIYYSDCDDFNDPKISHNDFWNNERIFCSDSEQCSFTSGVNGNIAADPLFGEDYCLLPGSPAIYGDVNLDQYMGHKSSCGATPTPVACVEECEIAMVYLDAPDCCPGLEGRTRFQIDDEGNCQPLFGGVICLGGCGDGQCLFCEDYCNCPEDCTPTSTPTPTPTIPTSINLKIKFDGVTSRPIDDSDREIKIYATNLTGGPDLGSADSKEIVRVTVDDSGVYHGEITFSSDHFGHRYRLRIKGPKHLQGVFPDVVLLQELNLTDWPLRPGDLDQDGDVDINDLQAVKVFSPDPADIVVGDVNFDGKVSIFDRTLVLNTLSVQYDPE